MTRTCRACPQPHPIYMQAEPNWYRPTAMDNLRLAVGCLAQVAGALIASLVLWGLLFALLMGGTN